jgi:hypothetical protein
MKQLPRKRNRSGHRQFFHYRICYGHLCTNKGGHGTLLLYKIQVGSRADHIRDNGTENIEQLTVVCGDKSLTVIMKIKTEHFYKIFLTI